MTIYNGMLRFPTVDHTNRPWIANAKGKYSNQSAKNLPTNQLQEATIEIGFFGMSFHAYTSNISFWDQY
jgi:hypothetical protein